MLLNQFIDKNQAVEQFGFIVNQLGDIEERIASINSKRVKISLDLQNNAGDLASVLTMSKELFDVNTKLLQQAKLAESVNLLKAKADTEEVKKLKELENAKLSEAKAEDIQTKARERAQKQDESMKAAIDKDIADIRKSQQALKDQAAAYDNLAERKAKAQAQRDTALAEKQLISEAKAAEKLAQDLAKLDKEIERNEIVTRKQIAALDKANEAYNKADTQHKMLLTTARNIGVEFGIESVEFKRAAEAANLVGNNLSSIDQKLGNYRRNVGNYASTWNGLSYSIGNLASELPNLGQSTEIFFRAISNNIIPIYQNLQQIRLENARLNAEGQITVSVWKQIRAAVFSVQTLLSVGVTLLLVFGEDIINLFTRVKDSSVKASSGVEILTNKTKILNEVYKASSTTYAATAAELDILKKRFFDAGTTVQTKLEIVKTLNSKYEDTIGKLHSINEAEKFFIERSDAFVQALAIRAQIDGAYQQIAENTKVLLAEQSTSAEDKLSSLKKMWYGLLSFGKTTYEDADGSIQELGKSSEELAEDNSKKSTARVKKAVDDQNAIIKKFIADSLIQLEDINKKNKFGSGKKEGTTPKESNTIGLEKQLRDEIAKLDRDTAKARLETDKKLQADIIKNNTTTQEDIRNSDTTNLNLRIAARYKYYEDVLAILELEEAAEVKANNNAHKATTARIKLDNISESEKNRLQLLENTRFEKQSTEITEKYTQLKTQALNDFADDSIADHDKVTKAIEDAEAESLQRSIMGMREYFQAIKDGFKDAGEGMANSLVNALSMVNEGMRIFTSLGETISHAIYDPQIAAQDEIIKGIQDRHDMEVSRIEATSTTEAQAKERIAELEANNYAASQAAENEKKRLKIEQARIDKAAAVMSIITKTALAAITAYTEGDPYTKALRAGLAVAVGASELAAALAAPLPQYYKGVDYSPATWAYVGEKGTEMRVNPDGGLELTPDRATLTYLDRGTKIIPHEQTKQILQNVQNNSVNAFLGSTSKERVDMLLARVYAEETRRSTKEIVRAIKSKTEKKANDNFKFAEYHHNKFKK